MNFKLKLKYKKVIFAVSLGTMAIGLAFLSINAKDDAKASNGQTANASPEAGSQSGGPEATPVATPDPSDLSQITKAPLEKNVYPEVNALVTQYLEASVEGDIDTVQTLLSESELITKEELTRRYEYYEGIKNIDCYTLPGIDQESYITYVYHEAKLVNIDTLAPGLISLYITRASNGKLVIMVNPSDEAVVNCMQLALKREDVQGLITTVNNNMQQALAADPNLMAFMENLKKAVEQQNANATATPVDPNATMAPDGVDPAADPNATPVVDPNAAPAADPNATPAAN